MNNQKILLNQPVKIRNSQPNIQLFLLIAILCLCCTIAFGQRQEYASNQLLIKWKTGISEAQKAELKNELHATTTKTFPNIGVELLEIPPLGNPDIKRMVKQYSNHPDLEFIEPNFYVYANSVFPDEQDAETHLRVAPELTTSATNPDDPLFSDQWALHNTGQSGGVVDADIDAPEAWDIATDASSVVVAVIDSGIDWTHEDLRDNIWRNPGENPNNLEVIIFDTGSNRWILNPAVIDGIDNDNNGYIDDVIGWDFVNNDNNPFDDSSHGTKVAGVIGAKGNNTTGVSGVTWDVQLAVLKTLSATNTGLYSDAAEALDYAVAMGIPISNNSWGGSALSFTLNLALQNANINNHLFVTGAGNSALNVDLFIYSPASYLYEYIIVVAATTSQDLLRSSSNYGLTNVDLGAPGQNILTLFPDNSYGISSGTSYSVAHVTGACALLKELYPNKTSLEIKDVILNSVDPIPALDGITVTGGRLNLYNALNYYNTDTDNDGVPALSDLAPLNPYICGDVDQDGCEDCLTGTSDPNNDGPDNDNDGICDSSDTDDDNDGTADIQDPAPFNPNIP